MSDEILEKAIFDLTMQLETAKNYSERLTRERDEARAQLKLSEWVSSPDPQQIAEAEQRGYRKGVEDAIAAGDGATPIVEQWSFRRAAILALLDKPKLSEPPHNESISGMAHKPSLSPQDKLG